LYDGENFMTGMEGLTSRQKRIVNGVLQELEHVISIPQARQILEAQSAGNILLANPDLQPTAFAIRHITWRTYVYGVIVAIFAWTIFFFFSLLLILAVIVLIALAIGSIFALNLSLLLRLKRIVERIIDDMWLERIEQRFIRETWAARRRRHNAYKRLLEDKRPPILYLRSFSFDLVDELSLEDARRADERLAEYYEQYGPVIAVAGPDDKGLMLGPVRLYFGDDIWRAGVIYLMSISQLVVIQVGISQGTLWELGMARRILEPEKLIISVADASDPNVADDNYFDFKPYAEVIFGCELPRSLGPSVCIGFGKNWEPSLYGSRYRGSPFKPPKDKEDDTLTARCEK
jgi:hypothetical protein